MPFNGAGVFNRVYNWTNDAAANIPITASRVDTEDSGFATGLSDCITKDGQQILTADIPWAGFKITGYGSASAPTARTDVPQLGQIQDSIANWVVAGGTADAITAAYSTAITALVDGQECWFRASAANATTTPTFAPSGLTAHTITKQGGSALTVGDIPAALAEIGLRYNLANTRWELIAPANPRFYDWEHAGTPAVVGGTANAITLTYPIAPSAYVQGIKFAFKATAANTSTTTVNVNALGVKNIFRKSSAGVIACAGGEIQVGDIVQVEYDGTQFQILGAPANAPPPESFATIASATSTAIGASIATYLQVTGTTTITSFDTVTAGTTKRLEFAGILTLTHDATKLILPGAASITTAAGDVAIMISEGSGNWRCANYMKASGLPVVTVGLAKASGLISSAAATIAGTPSVTAVKNSTGNYTVTFGITMPSVNYVPLIVFDTNGGSSSTNFSSITARTTTTFTVETFDNTGTHADRGFDFVILGTS